MVSRVRPELCRICECPVVDSGVQVEQLDAEQLSEWWRCKLDAEFETEDSKNEWICQFCLWEARLEHEHTNRYSDQANFNWWKGHDGNGLYYQNFYLNEVIQPCKVVLQQLPATADGHHIDVLKFDPSKSKSMRRKPQNKNRVWKTASCIFCREQILTNQMKLHITTKHKDKPLIKCSYYHCTTFFKLQHEREKHEAENHVKVSTAQAGNKNSKCKCVYCGLVLVRGSMKGHMQIFHNRIAIKCNLCVSYFLTKKERDEHQQNKQLHTRWALSEETECIYCKKVYRDKNNLHSHVTKVHQSRLIKCSVFGCSSFFTSIFDRDQHFEQRHRQEEAKKKFRCPDCDYKTINSSRLHTHKMYVHHTKNRFKCSCCAKLFFAKSVMKKHMLLVHLKLTKQCKFCGDWVKSMKQHQKPLVCKICDAKILCRGSAAQHKKVCS